MNNKAHFFLFLFCSLNYQILLGQDTYASEQINFSDGLPSDEVWSCIKKQGLLYIATQRGLCVYDGYRFIKNPYFSNVTYDLFSNKNKLYFYTSNIGLCSLKTIIQKPEAIATINYDDKDPNNDHYDNIFVDSEKRIWCSDVKNVKYFSKTKNQSFLIYPENKNPYQNIKFFQTKNKDLYISTINGVYIWDSKNNQVRLHPNSELSRAKIFTATVRENLTYFTTLDGKLLIYDPAKEVIDTKVISTSLDSKFSLVDNTNSFYLYSEKSLYSYDVSTNTKKYLHSFSGRINHVFYDKELHIFWISTSKGLVKLYKKNDSILNLDLPNPKTVFSIVQDDTEKIWCVTQDNRVYSYSKKENWHTYKSPYEGTVFLQLFIKDKQLYATANDGFYSFTNGILKQRIPSKIPFKKGIIDKNNLLWIIPSTGKIRVFDAPTFREKKEYILNDFSFWNENAFNDILEAPNGKIWFASWMPTNSGICYFDDNSRLVVPLKNAIKTEKSSNFISNYYTRIAIINDDNLIFSAYGGWNIVSPEGKLLKSLNTDLSKVVNAQIEGASQDSKGNIWFACAEGLNQYSFKTDKVVNLSSIDGLTTNDLTKGYFATKNDKLIIGSDLGLQLIDLNKITQTELVNELELTAFIKDGMYLNSARKEYTLNYDFTELVLLFSSLSYSETKKIVYRYQFEGEKNWNYLGKNPRLSLIKLPPDNYNIIIQAGDNLGNWQKKTLVIKLNIEPPFYNTFGFIGLMMLMVVLLVYFSYRYLISQVKMKSDLKRKINDLEMQMLRAQMNPHFLFNSLNSISSFIIQQKSREANSYLTTFSKLMRNILENSRRETISLEKELETLKMYLELESLRLDKKFDYQISIDRNVESENIKIPPLIIQPFAENAIWHGIHNKRGQGLLQITIALQKSNVLSIKITDDGIGRKASSLLKKEQIIHKSYGINITINRLILFNSKNKFEIKDLIDNQENAMGTEVELLIHI